MGGAKRQWTVLALIDWTKGFLARAGVDQPRLSAEVLLARTLGCERLQLYTRHDRTVAREQLVLYRDLVRRAAAGEPIAYLTGRKEFYSLSFKITPDVLILRRRRSCWWMRPWRPPAPGAAAVGRVHG